MIRPELVIFDMDGLMFDTERVAFQTWHQAADDAGYKYDFSLFRETLGVRIQRTEEILMAHFGPQFPFSSIMNEQAVLADQWYALIGVPLKSGLVELLEYLTRQKIKKAVATSTYRDKGEHLIQKAGVFGYFDTIVYGSDVTNSKPHPEIFLKAAERLSCQPENCIVLEDSNLGILAAHLAGMMPVMIPDLVEPDNETKRLVFAQFRSLKEFQAELEQTFV